MSESNEPTIYGVRELVFDQQKRISELESENESLRNELDAAKETLAATRSRLKKLEDEVYSSAGRDDDEHTTEEGRVDPTDSDSPDEPADGWSFGDWRDADVLETIGLDEQITFQAIKRKYEKRAGLVDEDVIDNRAERLVKSELFEANGGDSYTFVSEDIW